MYKKLTALALLTAAACVGTSAQAADLTGWFVNGGVGTAHYDAHAAGLSGSESDNSFQFNAGWRSQFIGLEGGYVDLGSISEHDDLGNSIKLSGKGWTAGINGHFNPTEKWYISARVGLFLWSIDANATLNGQSASGSDHHTNGYAGIGTGFDINRHWSIGVNGDYYQMKGHGYKVNTKVYSANLEYRF
ncbi:MAG TPA: outer membrane beta-barrel protein [Rhodanobacteraceae bacterium]